MIVQLRYKADWATTLRCAFEIHFENWPPLTRQLTQMPSWNPRKNERMKKKSNSNILKVYNNSRSESAAAGRSPLYGRLWNWQRVLIIQVCRKGKIYFFLSVTVMNGEPHADASFTWISCESLPPPQWGRAKREKKTTVHGLCVCARPGLCGIWHVSYGQVCNYSRGERERKKELNNIRKKKKKKLFSLSLSLSVCVSWLALPTRPATCCSTP
jgi:hypothetical protein